MATHTFGPSCRLHDESNVFMRRASEVSNEPPRARARFFYASALPIDDPLSPLPTPSTGSNAKLPARPFSTYDNAALEEAWQGIHRGEKGSDTSVLPQKPEGLPSFHVDHGPQPADVAVEAHLTEGEDGKRPERKHLRRWKSSSRSRKANASSAEETVEPGRERGHFDSLGRLSKKASRKFRNKDARKGRAVPLIGIDQKEAIAVEAAPLKTLDPSPFLEPESSLAFLSQGDPFEESCDGVEHPVDHVPLEADILLGYDDEHLSRDNAGPMTAAELRGEEPTTEDPEKKNRVSPGRSSHASMKALRAQRSSEGSVTPQPGSTPVEFDRQYGASPSERDMTGNPFQRAPPRDHRSRLSLGHIASNHTDDPNATSGDESYIGSKPAPVQQSTAPEVPQAYVPVGLSRLHLVEMPNLEMKPIYWSPVHDVSAVVRGTWFYKDKMTPVETDVANMLELGYEAVRPWSQTYEDEVRSCLEVGADAELKLIHKLWPLAEPRSSSIAEGVDVTKAKVPKDALNHKNRAAGCLEYRKDQVETRLYELDSVMYADSREAQILRPNQLPSITRGRRPLGPVRKGKQVGIVVVRGFDYKAWEKLSPTKKGSTAAKARAGAAAMQSGAAATVNHREMCEVCEAEEHKPQVNDLVLVIHGIGQKLSERVESFHFTHAINSFRRQMAIELESDTVQGCIRADQGGVMVLPVNWRSTLTLDGDSSEDEAKNANKSDSFSLKDITADTIPSVRSLISDVMFDIPYYLSHHKPKMVEAVIKEANRVYRLWCRNNPRFQETGRVHLIAHSLGSIMALDILSKQPTHLPRNLNLTDKKVNSHMFEFDTKNVFFCGSPAGFFLLLNHAPLLPRRGRVKPGSDGEDASPDVAGEVGTYGCLAIDNIYNVMHYNDPIAYKLNACVDVALAASLEPAAVPSSVPTWAQSLGSLFRGSKPVPLARASAGLDALPARPGMAKLPSTVEMETHDFSREELAERKMYLLNDNGQIDYFLSSGGGPLEFQYLNMLGAHSSYWTLQDFIRFVLVEVGREHGREGTLEAMRAVKRGRKR